MVTGTSTSQGTRESIATRRRSFLASAASVAVLGSGCLELGGSGSNGGAGDAADWPTYRGDWGRTGVAPADAGPGESLSMAWETAVIDVARQREADLSIAPDEESASRDQWVLGTALVSPVTLTDGRVLGTIYYRLYNETDGRRDWGGVVGLNPETGDLEYTITGIAVEYQAPSIVDGRLHVPVVYPLDADADGAHLLIADAESGSVVDRVEIDGFEPSTKRITIADSGVYVASGPREPGDLLALDRTTWDRRWEASQGAASTHYYPYTVVDDTVVFTDSDGDGPVDVVALDASSGERRWRRSVDVEPVEGSSAELLGAPCVEGDRGYVTGSWDGFRRNGAQGSVLHAFELGDGSERWQFRPDPVPFEELQPNTDSPLSDACFGADECPQPDEYAGLYGTPVAVDGRVVAGGFGEPAPGYPSNQAHYYVYGVDEEDGSLEWSVGGAIAGPVAAGDVIYAKAIDEAVMAISTDGERLDLVRTDRGHSWAMSPTIGHGRLYAQWGHAGTDGSAFPATFVAFE